MQKIIAGIPFGVALCIIVLNRIGYFQRLNAPTEKLEEELAEVFKQIFMD